MQFHLHRRVVDAARAAKSDCRSIPLDLLEASIRAIGPTCVLFLCVCRRQLIMIELGHFCDARWLLFVVASLLIPECGSDSGEQGSGYCSTRHTS